jgi:hypothetical protein
MSEEENNPFSNPDAVVSLLVPNMKDESITYKYLKQLCKGFAVKSTSPAQFVELVTAQLSHENDFAKRNALSSLKRRAIEHFALDKNPATLEK